MEIQIASFPQPVQMGPVHCTQWLPPSADRQGELETLARRSLYAQYAASLGNAPQPRLGVQGNRRFVDIQHNVLILFSHTQRFE
jgi:hypothetical protein